MRVIRARYDVIRTYHIMCVVISASQVRGPVGFGPARGVVEALERHDGLFGRPSGVVVVGRRTGVDAVRFRVRARAAAAAAAEKQIVRRRQDGEGSVGGPLRMLPVFAEIVFGPPTTRHK